MDSIGIYIQANRLVQHYGTNDPIRLTDDMGILVWDVTYLTDLLGMYTASGSIASFS